MLRLASSTFFRRIAVWTTVLTVFIGFGCSNWETVTPTARDLPIPRMSSDSVAMEIAFVRVPADETQRLQQLWTEIDEQLLPPTQRSHLNENGFRCGLVGVQLPIELRNLLESEQQTSALERSTPGDLDVLHQNGRIQCRAGKRTEIPTCPARDEMVILHKDGDRQKVGGTRLSDALCVFGACCFPQGNGAVRVELIPEIHHGTPRRQWVAGEGTFHLVTAREREVYSDLRFEATLMPGQTLVLSCTPEFGLGHNFFLDATRGDPQQKLLLIRLSQTQRDDLFETPSAQDNASGDVLPISEM
jgi:hypothetical protein